MGYIKEGNLGISYSPSYTPDSSSCPDFSKAANSSLERKV